MTTKEADMRADEFPQDFFSLDIDNLEIVSSKESASQKCKSELVSLFNMPHQSPQPELSGALDLELTMMDHSDMLLNTGIEGPDLNSDLSLGSILNSVTSAGFTAATEVTSPSTLSLTDLQPIFNSVTAAHSSPFCVTPTNSYTSEGTPCTTPGCLTPAPSPNSSYPSSPRGGIILTKSAYSSGATTPTGLGGGGTRAKIPRHKRQSHIRAEYKRRNKIQNGFDEIQALIPSIQDASISSKESKSNMLNKTVDFCRQLKAENKALLRESDQLRAEIDGLTADIKTFQENMPDSGLKTPTSAPSSPVSVEKQFEDYLHARTVSNWKFWIFGLLARPLFESYNHSVNTNNVEDFLSSVLSWVEENLSLRNLRPAVFNTLRHVSKNTSIIGDPSRLPEEALQAALSMPVKQTGTAL